MRIWFDYSPLSRPVRGGLIIDIQLPLTKAGLLAGVDGIYGSQTARAIRLWQAGRNLNPTGATDELTWQGLTDTDAPPLFRRCLSLTAAFEGHGYTLAQGNFDGAFLTWGIIGFTLKAGNLGEVIKRTMSRHPGLLADAMGADKAAELLDIIAAPSDKQLAWGDGLSMEPKSQLRQDWRDAFEMLGNRREVRAIQDEVAHDVYWARAIQDLHEYGRMTEIDAALFFDTSVQNGGVDDAKGAAIKSALSGAATLSNRERLGKTADAIAANSSPKYRDDVKSRRGTIAAGAGTVHGASYKIEHWGLGDFPIADRDLV
jgi:hypothetical protein